MHESTIRAEERMNFSNLKRAVRSHMQRAHYCFEYPKHHPFLLHNASLNYNTPWFFTTAARHCLSFQTSTFAEHTYQNWSLTDSSNIVKRNQPWMEQLAQNDAEFNLTFHFIKHESIQTKNRVMTILIPHCASSKLLQHPHYRFVCTALFIYKLNIYRTRLTFTNTHKHPSHRDFNEGFYLIQTVLSVRLRVHFNLHNHRIRSSYMAKHFGEGFRLWSTLPFWITLQKQLALLSF